MTAAAARPARRKEPFHPEHPLAYYIWKLLRLRIILTISTFRGLKLWRKIGTVIIYLLILAFAAGVFAVSWLLLSFLRSPELADILAQQNQPSVAPFLETVPVFVLSAAFLGILVTSFGVLLQALYLAGDMDFLLSAPVPIRAVFVSKQLQAILPNFGFIALFGLPVLFGLGASGGYNFLYYPLVVVVLALLALAAAGVSSLLVMGVVRIVPARRVAEMLGFVGATISIICSQSGSLFRTVNWDEQSISAQQIPLSSLTRFNAAWNPLSWAGRGLVEFGEGRWGTAVLFLGLTFAITGGLFLLSLNTAERLYYSGWASMQAGGRKKRTIQAKSAAPVRAGAGSAFLARFIPQPVLGIVGKDFLTMRRDLRNMSQLITPIIFGVIYGVFLFRSGGGSAVGQDEAPEWIMQMLQSAAVYGSIALSLFVGWSLISRLGMIGFSQEGNNYWILKTAPVGTDRLLAAKFLVAYLPGLVLGELFMLVISLLRGASVTHMLYGAAVVAVSIIGSVGINLAFGVTGVNLTWTDPRRMNPGWSGCVGALASFAYMAASMGLFFGPPLLSSALGFPELAGQTAGFLLGGVFSVVCAVVPLWLVASRVARIGES
jgi:ABC-2 type transport system permease protein